MISIYGLVDPLSPEVIRYIGQTSKATKRRLYEHVADARRGKRNRRCTWIRSVLNAGRYPVVVPLASVLSDWPAVERLVIAQFDGLVNGTEGGEGITLTEDIRNRRVESRRWYKHGAEVRAKISALHKGRRLTIEHRAKLSAAAKKRAPIHLEKLAAAKRGTRASVELRQKLSAAQKLRWQRYGRRKV